MKNKFIRLIWVILLIGLSKTYSLAIQKIYLNDVIFLKKPVKSIVFEFDHLPKYEIKKEKKKLIFIFYNTIPQTSSWIKNLPKNLFKEINAIYEKDKLYLEFSLTKSFNFKISPLENKLITEFIWEEVKKPTKVIIKGEEIKYVKEKPLEEIEKMLSEKKPKFPEYEIYLETHRIKLPLTRYKYKGTPVSVDFQQADIHAVLRFLAEIGGINIITSEKVKGLVTLKAKNVPWDLLLDVILANHGLAKITINNVVRIGTLEEIKKEVELYRDYMVALGQSSEGIRTEIESQRDILRAIQETQERTNILITKTFKLKYIRAGKVIDLMKNQRISEKLSEILKDPNVITCEPLTNTLIVKATPKVLEEVERIVKEIDKPRPQILIEARIVEISNTYVHQLGVRWGGSTWRFTEHSVWNILPAPAYNYTYEYPPGVLDLDINSTIPTFVDLGVPEATSNLGIVLGYIGKNVALLDFQLSLLEEKGLGRIISKPVVLTSDRETAEIKQGYKIPYLVWMPEMEVPTIEFIDAGLILKVTPSLTPEGRILLDIEIERSYPDWGRTVQDVPTIVTESLQTSAFVDNGETLVLGGIKVNSVSENINKVPGLGNIPGIGELFKGKEKKLENTELLIFITPKIAYIPIAGIDY